MAVPSRADSRIPFLKKFFFSVLLLVISILFFALPQPNIFSVQGFPLFAYIAFVPVFLLVRLVSWKEIWFYGLLYGIGSYCLFTYWLASFHPMGIFVISFMYGLYLMFTFPLLKAVNSFFPKYGWIAQWVVLCSYDYVKTLGFAGFNYGVMAYSHWRWLPMIQCTDVLGVWGLDAFILFFSAWVSILIVDAYKLNCSDENKNWIKCLFVSVKKHLISIGIWFFALVSIFIYGFISPVDYSNDKSIQVALIQQNSDPWVGGVKAYKKDLNTLIRLSDEAIANNPEVDFVVWPETAFVPRIEWHYKHRYDREKFELVEKLLNFINNSKVPFVFGNDHGIDGYTSDGQYGVIDYNSVLLFRPGVNVIPPKPEIYSKMKLVPFTEYFPFDKAFPKLYELLLNGDTHMWEPGLEPVVFDIDGLKFGTPICFEDTFGFVCRRFVNAGANSFVNLSNDAWSKSLACQYQHLSMAVFRSVENRVPAVRATTTGQTSVIDPNGKILDMAEPFIETYLIGNIPVRENMNKTIYTKYGDYVGVIFAVLSVILFIAGLTINFIKKKK